MCAAGVFENDRVYFAYGSNLHPLRMIDRLGSDIRLLGIAFARTLIEIHRRRPSDHRVTFRAHK